MKFNIKFFVVLGICLVVFIGIFVYYKNLPSGDIFYGDYYSKVEKENLPMPGTRFKVKVSSIPDYFHQVGDATGVVIVNDPEDRFKHFETPGPDTGGYIFYTEYDPSNNWYTLKKIEKGPYIPHGQYIPEYIP